jgi:PAS domain S-box-containing protein
MEHTRPEFPGALALGRDLPMTAAAAEVARAVLGSAGALPVGPGHAREVKREIAEHFGVRSEILMALRPKGEQPYLFGLHQCSHSRTWTKDEQRLFEEIGHRLTEALASLIALRRLRESERRSEAAQRVAHVGWWERDYLSGQVSLSDEACRIFGVQPLDLPQWHGRWLSLIHPEDRSRVAAASEAALAGGARYDVEYRVVRADGVVRVVHSQGDITRDDSGAPVRQFGVMQDITELRRVEDELRASEARFRTFVDRATDAFFLLDERLLVVDVNRQACENLGWSREELIGMHPRDYDVGLDDAAIARLAERTSAGETVTFETRHRRRDGTAFPVEIRAGTFTQGSKLFYLALARDVSERKLAEERKAKLAAIVESSDDAIIGKDLNGIITTWNAGAERIFGYAAQEVIGQSVTILTPPDRVDEARGILDRIRRGERVHHYETVRRRKDGTLLDMSLSVSPIFDDSGNVVGASKVARDISERKRAEETLRAQDRALETARTELARVSRLTTLGELTTSIAHEVSQPLGAMVASAGACVRWLAADPPAMAEARAALDNIVADGKRAREVIARVRALTKGQAPRKDRLDVNHKIAEVLALMDRELRSHDIRLRTDLDRRLPGVAGDRVQLQQVLLNLIMNAIEAMSAVHDRARELTIVSRQDAADAVLVEVRDSGSGLDPQRAERVFEAFYTTKAEGIGIGLSISRSIIEAHGGRLWASANAPHGAVFRFSLPIAEEAAS